MRQLFNALYVLLLSAAPLSAQWQYAYYPNPPHRLDDCEAVDSTTFWASGANGYIIKSTDAGRTWSGNYGPIGNDYDFYEIDFAGPKFGWAATGYFSPVKLVATADYGESWQIISDSLDLGWISDLEFADSLNGFISGSWTVRRTTDGGSTWLAPDSFVSDLWIQDLELSGRDTVWACGYLGQGPLTPVVARTTDTGRTWRINAILDDTLNSWARAIEFADPRHGWVTTNSLVSDPCPMYATTDGGENWGFVFEFDEGEITEFGNIVAFDSLNMRAAGYLGGGGGMIKRSTDGGLTWADEFWGEVGTITHFMMSDSVHGLVVGGPHDNSPLLLYYDSSTDLVGENITDSPSRFRISDTYPNPFNPSCSWTANDLPDEAIIYDLLGRMVRNIFPNSTNIIWDGSGNDGAQISSGYYIAVFRKGADLTRRAAVKID